ncbi:alpha/beta-hydrolase family protein [Kineosporia rhizophila]|uniref:alpha/beta-hydrolase family protein n=1 Tax=Kineosporia TaxID=49184 RepID=UPI001E5C9F49|nr:MULTISPECIES: alpha/beta-hydrolase family protein [Kineosporia]MCE0534739.1 alpha/beta-hydrolase family protein [Kineosporia rhizophila]
MLALVLPSRLLPHPLPVDLAIGAVAALLGYLLAAGARSAVRAVLPRAPALSRLALLLTITLMVTAGLRTRARLIDLRTEIGLPGSASDATYHAVVAVLGASLSAALVVGLVSLLRRLSWPHLAFLAALPLVFGVLVSARSGPQSLGPKGAEFLADARDAATISAITQRPASTPHRIYIPLDAAPSHRGRARAAVEATAGDGGFDTAAVLLIIPTGSGWVNPRIARTVEELYDGDLTTVAVQYGTTPSWQAYLRGGAGVQESAQELIRDMRTRIDQLPAGRRPKLLVYGESLGAWGLLPALDRPDSGVDAALLTGVPGNPQISSTDTAVLNHPDDPVPGWSLHLPPVSFLRASADAIASEAVPIGHGHRYGAETTAAWCGLLQLPSCRG